MQPRLHVCVRSGPVCEGRLRPHHRLQQEVRQVRHLRRQRLHLQEGVWHPRQSQVSVGLLPHLVLGGWKFTLSLWVEVHLVLVTGSSPCPRGWESPLKELNYFRQGLVLCWEAFPHSQAGAEHSVFLFSPGQTWLP